MLPNLNTQSGWHYIRQWLRIWLPLVLVLAAVLWLLYQADRKAFVEVVRAEQKHTINLATQVIATELKMLQSDVLFLADQTALQYWLDNRNTSTKASLENNLIAFTRHRGHYDQIRFIDIQGQELVRVNWNSGEPALVSADRLQNKAHRYYVQKTLELGKGDIFVSRFDLNIEKNKIEQPIIPVIRVATPVFDSNGRQRGLIVLNYMGQTLLERLREISDTIEGNVWLLNADGYWLLGPSADQEWGFMYEDERRALRFDQQYQQVWAAMLTGPAGGQLRLDQGLFSYATIQPQAQLAGEYSERWILLAHVPAAALATSLAGRTANLFIAFILLALLLAIIAALITRRDIQRQQAETRVRESEVRFRGVLDSAPDAIVIVDQNGHISLINSQTEQWFGYDRNELIGQPVEKLIPERFRGNHINYRKNYSADPVLRPMGADIELFGLRKDGTEFPVEISLSPLKTEHGLLVTSIIRDISARKRDEMRLRESEQRFRGLLNSAPDAIVIVDQNGHISLINNQTEQWFGYDRGELLGRPIETLIPERYRERHTVYRQNYAARPVVRPMGANIELFGLRKDGSEFPVEISLSPLKTERGMLVTSIIRDVTVRKQVEQAQKQAQERYRELVNNLPVGVYRNTPGEDGHFLEANPAMLDIFEAQSSEEFFMHTVSDLYCDPAKRTAFNEKILRQGYVTGEELHLKTLRGRKFYAAITAVLKKGSDGSIFFDGIVEDISARRKSEQRIKELNDNLRARSTELEVVNKELEAFCYSVSHDLRAPLRAIDGFSHSLLKDYADQLNDAGRDRLTRVRVAAQRMAKLIDDLLNLSRVSRTETKLQEVDLTQITNDVIQELYQIEPDRKIRFSVQPNLHIRGDAQLLRIAMDNLVGNAWKFTGRHVDAVIEIGSRLEGNQPVYYVKDDGAGFDMTYADKLFGAFQRLHNEDEFPGTGIGLATVHRVIQKHGGRIWAESAVEQGATFYFTLQEGKP